MRVLTWAAVLFCIGVAMIPARHPQGGEWTVEHYITQENASGFEISPDGGRVVWSKSTVELEEQKREARLQLTDLQTLETIELTQGPHDAGNAKWSPDGKLIALLTDRPDPKFKGTAPEGPQIWLIRASGGEAWALTQVERGVNDFEWSGNDSIVFIAAESKSNYEQEIENRKDTSVPIDDEAHEPPVRLFGVDLDSRETVRLSQNRDWIESLKVSPNGRYAVTVHSKSLRYGYDQKIGPEVYLWNLEDETSERILKDFRHGIGSVSWRDDSKGFYFAADYSTDPVYVMASESRLHWFDRETKASEPIPLQTGKGLLFGMIRSHPKGVLTILEDGTKTNLALYHQDGSVWKRDLVAGTHIRNLWDLEVSKDGKRIVYAHSTASKPEQYFTATFDGASLVGEKSFTKLNASWSELTPAKSEAVTWKGALNEDVEGMLYYPKGYEPGKRYALVLMIHGGPLGHDPDTWNDNWGDPVQLYSQRGAFVLKPNYHGSSGYGLAFAESIRGGRYYTLPVEDIQKGVEHLIAKGLVDPGKLSTMGWSNGAILSTALTVADPRYKAASVGAGGADWTSDWGFCAFGQAFSNYYLGKAPIEDPELYRRNAPIYDFAKIKTPTIFFHGTEDRAVPTFHSWSMYRTLQYLGSVPTKLVTFPGEPHSIGKPSHRRRKLVEELAWFDRYLFGKVDDPAPNEALREGSNLSDLIELLKAKSVEGLYGELRNGIVAPETVAYSGMSVGRFEVTRAQYAAFDSSYRYAADSGNYPANGVSLEKAKAYCQWLSQKTGQTYRLPSQEEAEKLYGDGATGNTLDAWAGYAVNPDDAARLVALIKTLPPGALLKKVGRSDSTGKPDRVYDLGGNVAEWCTTEGGQGAALGGSADTPEDLSSTLEPQSAYIGLRVVEVKK